MYRIATPHELALLGKNTELEIFIPKKHSKNLKKFAQNVSAPAHLEKSLDGACVPHVL